MDHLGFLDEAKTIVEERARTYGGVSNCFDRIASIASLVLNRPVSAHEVAMIQVCVKLGRLAETPDHRDSFVDAINYLAFAAEFSGAGVPDDARLVFPTHFAEARARSEQAMAGVEDALRPVLHED